MLILLTVCHTFHIFYLSLTDFQNFPGPGAFLQDFPVLENATVKFQDFPGFQGPVRTLHKVFTYFDPTGSSPCVIATSMVGDSSFSLLRTLG